MKICCRCKEQKSIEAFNKDRKKPDGLNIYCRSCMKVIWRKHYDKDPSKYNKRSQYRRIKLKEQFKYMKTGLKCVQCGEDHPATLDFHHRDPSEKEKEVSIVAQYYGLDRLQKEIDKCDVLCSNCHRKLHWEQKQRIGLEDTTLDFDSRKRGSNP